MFNRIRPQIFLAIFVLGALAAMGMFYGEPQVSTATIGGIIALGMKVLESSEG